MAKKKRFFEKEGNRRALFISLWVAFIIVIAEMLGVAVKMTISGLMMVIEMYTGITVRMPAYNMEILGYAVMAIAIFIVIRKFEYLAGD